MNNFVGRFGALLCCVVHFSTYIKEVSAKTQPLTNSTLTYLELNAQFSSIKDVVSPYSKFLSVFLLSSLQNAVELGESFLDIPGTDDYFARIRAAQLTWAFNIRYFYSVVGAGDAERRVLSNSSICTNLTSDYFKRGFHGEEHIFLCKGIKVLFLPYCDAGSWGHSVSLLIVIIISNIGSI